MRGGRRNAVAWCHGWLKGSRRARTRPRAKLTTAPARSSSSTPGSPRINRSACSSGVRSLKCRKQYERRHRAVPAGEQRPKVGVPGHDHAPHPPPPPQLSRRRSPRRDQSRTRAPRRDLPQSTRPRPWEQGWRRQAVSRRGCRQLTFAHRRGRKLQGREDVCALEIWIVGEDLIVCATRGELADNRADRHPQPTDAGEPSHLLRVHGDPLERHIPIVRPLPGRCGGSMPQEDPARFGP
jgi:hypothetical protein